MAVSLKQNPAAGNDILRVGPKSVKPDLPPGEYRQKVAANGL
jgi:hypothetical protein